MTNVPPAGDEPQPQTPPQSQPPPDHYGAGGGYGPPPSRPSNGVGIAALVVGIVALLLFWIPFLGVVLAIVGLVLGIVGIRKVSRREATNKGMAIAGVVTGALALLGGVLITIGAVAFFSSDEFQNFAECVNQAETVEERQDCQSRFERDFGR